MMLCCSDVKGIQNYIYMGLVLGEKGENRVNLRQPFAFDFELIVGEEEELC